LWYLTEETNALSFFDDSIPLETKRQMVKALKKKSTKNLTKRLIIQPNQIDNTFLGKHVIYLIDLKKLKINIKQ